MADESETLGTLVRTSNGKIYFISEEVLARCEVTNKEAAESLNRELEGYSKKSGFSFKPGFEIAMASIPKSAARAGGFQGGRFKIMPDEQVDYQRVVAVW